MSKSMQKKIAAMSLTGMIVVSSVPGLVVANEIKSEQPIDDIKVVRLQDEEMMLQVSQKVEEATKVIHISQKEIDSKPQARAYLENIIDHIDLQGATVEITEEVFDPIIKGTPRYKNGFDGYYRYNIILRKEGYEKVLYGKDMVYGKIFIKAIPYE